MEQGNSPLRRGTVKLVLHPLEKKKKSWIQLLLRKGIATCTVKTLEWDLQEQDADMKPRGNRKKQVLSSPSFVIFLQRPLLAEPNRVPTGKGEMCCAVSQLNIIKQSIVW